MKGTCLKDMDNDEFLLYYARLLGANDTSEEKFIEVESEILARMAVNNSVVVNNVCKTEK